MASLLGPAAFIANNKRKLTTPPTPYDESNDNAKKKKIDKGSLKAAKHLLT